MPLPRPTVPRVAEDPATIRTVSAWLRDAGLGV